MTAAHIFIKKKPIFYVCGQLSLSKGWRRNSSPFIHRTPSFESCVRERRSKSSCLSLNSTTYVNVSNFGFGRFFSFFTREKEIFNSRSSFKAISFMIYFAEFSAMLAEKSTALNRSASLYYIAPLDFKTAFRIRCSNLPAPASSPSFACRHRRCPCSNTCTNSAA